MMWGYIYAGGLIVIALVGGRLVVHRIKSDKEVPICCIKKPSVISEETNTVVAADSLHDTVATIGNRLQGLTGSETSRLLNDSKDNKNPVCEEIVKKYRSIIDALKCDLQCSEKDCAALQKQIRWLNKRKAELITEVYKDTSGKVSKAMAEDFAESQRIDHKALFDAQNPLPSMMRPQPWSCTPYCGLSKKKRGPNPLFDSFKTADPGTSREVCRNVEKER